MLFVILLYEENYVQTRLFAVSVWLMQENFLQYDFSVKIFILRSEKIKEIPQIKHVSKTKQNEKRTNRRNKIRGLIEGEFVSTQGYCKAGSCSSASLLYQFRWILLGH